jgi:pimeloyl-ACP methyl ester carboxylesterase
VSELQQYKIDVPESDLDDLRQRLARTRWPERELVADWSQGIPLEYVQDVCSYWAQEYDWRRCESEINSYEQAMYVGDDGPAIHVLHARSPHDDALPVVFTHGWPGSIVEFLDVIGPLTDPTAHRGDASDAMHVICPSLPGFGFSGKPTETGWGVERIADRWVDIMTALGYERFGAQGGDWGSSVTNYLALRHPDRLAGVHLNMVIAFPGPDDGDPTEAEQASLASMTNYQQWEAGYSTQQSTRPQTVGYGLVDSPAAQAAWVLEKFWAWVDHQGHPEDVFTRDRLLDNVMMYWLTATGASSARLYWESFRSFVADPVTVPSGLSIFPKEIFRASRRWAEHRYTDIRHWNELDTGGHFAAFEQPGLFVDEVRAFFREVR